MLVDIEAALLGKLTETKAVRECWDRGVRLELFSDPLNQQVYRFVIDYWMGTGMEEAPSRQVIETEFERDRYELQSSREALGWLIEQLHKTFRTGRVQQIMYEAAELVSDDPGAALALLAEESWKAKELTSPRADRVDMALNVQERRRQYLEDASRPRVIGAPIGLPEVDDFIGGILPSEVAIVGAYTKTGKSFALIQSAITAHKQESGLYIPYIASLEMPTKEFQTRIDALYSGVGYGKLQHNQLNQAELRQLHAAQDEMAARGPLILERPPEGERTVSSICNRARQMGCNYVIIDQLSWLETRRYYRERRDQYKELIYDLKSEVSNESAGAMPCYIAGQFNRLSTGKEETMGLQHFANAADIEQTIDIAFGLKRNQEMRANSSMEFRMLGSRRSDLKHFLLGWYLGNESRIFVRNEIMGDD